ncbi:hypothetical protein [Marinomonas balearica]|uniref:CMD domain protein n=1 Tax=Marinomonas balearica TaxID=491947 RepID=A0A4R6M2C5_9GAMM|nr:hypothetical protein [Marinomonas balearica]TDO95314.1 hypothetical protein DFP79_3555 [Marinomonas balearica]
MIDTSDTIGINAELAPNNLVRIGRMFRPEFIEGAKDCRYAVLTPNDPLDLLHDLRVAVARRITKTAANPDSQLKGYPIPTDESLKAFSAGEICTDPKLAVLAAHVDMIASEPSKASAQHLSDLQTVGFSVPQIIALSELCAYVCFQIRLVHGLSLLETHHE